VCVASEAGSNAGALVRLGEGRPRALPCDAEKIRALRGRRTRAEIAKLASVSPWGVRIAESEGARISERILERLAAALGVSADDIRIRAPITNPPPRRQRSLALEEYTSLGLGSSLGAVVSESGESFFDDL
jgi:hypothetical protein